MTQFQITIIGGLTVVLWWLFRKLYQLNITSINKRLNKIDGGDNNKNGALYDLKVQLKERTSNMVSEQKFKESIDSITNQITKLGADQEKRFDTFQKLIKVELQNFNDTLEGVKQTVTLMEVDLPHNYLSKEEYLKDMKQLRNELSSVSNNLTVLLRLMKK